MATPVKHPPDVTPSEKPLPARPNALLKSAAQLGCTISVIVLLVTLAGLGARWSQRLELLTHFKLQLAVGAALGLCLLLPGRRWQWATVAAAVLVWHLCGIVPFYLPQAKPVGGDKTSLRALYANVHWQNPSADRLLQLVREEQPDVIVFAEATPGWRRKVESLSPEYPHIVSELRDDPFGILLLSRIPLKRHKVHFSSAAGFPSICAVLEVGGRELTVIGTHPPPPGGNGSDPSLRDQQIQELGELVKQQAGPVLLLGDLNCTSWSPVFTDLLAAGDLRDGQMGFGIQPSWPNFPWLMRIPIDHTLVTQDLQVTGRRLGPDIGSDHRPVMIDVVVEQAPE